jgi:hypothetical protein
MSFVLNLSALICKPPCVMWRVSVTLSASATTTRDPSQGDCMLSCTESWSETTNKKITRINFLTYTECQTAQRGRARAVIGSWSEHSWQRRVGWVRIGPEQKRQRRKNRESEKQREKNEQTNKTGVFPRSCRPPGYVKEKWCSQPVSRGARGTADVRVFPNSGWCYGCGHCRGAALLALSVSVRSQRAADATVTAARRCSATIVSVSLEVLTPLRSMIDDVGFSLSRWARSVPASDGIGWWLIHACWFEEPGGS